MSGFPEARRLTVGGNMLHKTEEARVGYTRAFSVVPAVYLRSSSLPTRNNRETAAMKRRDEALVGTLPDKMSV